MLKRIKVVPLAAESLGVRSMCTYVETPDVRILLDAGASLCLNRFGLPPHPKEYQALSEARRRIAVAAEKAEIITLSHYHYDHYTPSFEDWLCNWTAYDDTARQIYEDKRVLMKNPRGQINYSQRRRGWMFQKTSGKYAKKLENADGKTFVFGDTQVTFSEPVPHGSEESALGWVLMTTIEFRGDKFLFAPDVQGPMSSHTLETIVKQKPQLLMIGGPPLYLATFKVEENQIQIALRNLGQIVENVPCVILEHHILRDEQWREKTTGIFYVAYKSEHTVLTAAEYSGKISMLLEAVRKRLFTEDPPAKEFQAWMRLSEETKMHTKPPV